MVRISDDPRLERTEMSMPRMAMAMAGLLLCSSTTALAQEDVEKLEQTFSGLAEESIPKTVLIKVRVGSKMGSGSGAIISPDGYILTCTHVVEIGTKVEVVTSDGKTFKAEVLGKNIRQDYALLKIDARNLAHYTMGDSDTVKPGQWVAALGHPGGPYADVQPAFAAGKVRALEMKLPVGLFKKYYNHAIMTDVPIFAGNSGGPLINMKGELVGINGAIIMLNEMAFAIPLNQIKPHLKALKAGKVMQGEQAGPEAWDAMKKLVSPEDYQRMMQRQLKNLGKNLDPNNPLRRFLEKDGPLGKLFEGQGGDLDLRKLFGGGEMPDLRKLFEGQGGIEEFNKLFGEQFAKLFEKQFKDLFGPNSRFKFRFLTPDNLPPELKEMFGKEFGKMFGNDLPPELKKMLGKEFERLFGGKRGDPFGGLRPRPRPPRVIPRPRPVARPKVKIGLRVIEKPGVQGLVVQGVEPGGPGDLAGVQKDDVLKAIEGRAVRSFDDLIRALKGKRPDDVIRVTVRREVFLDTKKVEKDYELSISLGAR